MNNVVKLGYFLDAFFIFYFQKMWIEKFPYYTYYLLKKLTMPEVRSWQSLREEKYIAFLSISTAWSSRQKEEALI